MLLRSKYNLGPIIFLMRSYGCLIKPKTEASDFLINSWQGFSFFLCDTRCSRKSLDKFSLPQIAGNGISSTSYEMNWLSKVLELS